MECVHSVANEGAFKHDSLSFALKKEIVFQFHKALHFCKVWSYDHKFKSENGEISNENIVHIGSCSTPPELAGWVMGGSRVPTSGKQLLPPPTLTV